MTTCPACQRDVPEGAQTCPYCGVVFAKWKPRPTPSHSKGSPIELTAQSVSRAMELSPEEKNRIYLEEKARLEAQERIRKDLAQQEVESQERIRKQLVQEEQAKASNRRVGYGVLAGTFLLFVAFCSYFTSEQSPPEVTNASQKSTGTVPSVSSECPYNQKLIVMKAVESGVIYDVKPGAILVGSLWYLLHIDEKEILDNAIQCVAMKGVGERTFITYRDSRSGKKVAESYRKLEIAD